MASDGLTFYFAPEVLALGVTGVYFVLEGVKNQDSHVAFEAVKERVLAKILAEVASDSIKDDPILQGFRQLHSAMGCSNRKNVAAPESLLKHVVKSGQLPHVNLLVDIYNLVSLETRLALGAHDIDKIDGNVSLRLTNGQENFWPLGEAAPKPVKAGEYAYIDDANDVICHLEVKQVEKTKVTLDTTRCFYTVQGNKETDGQYVWDAAQRLIDLTQRFCGGRPRILYKPFHGR